MDRSRLSSARKLGGLLLAALLVCAALLAWRDSSKPAPLGDSAAGPPSSQTAAAQASNSPQPDPVRPIAATPPTPLDDTARWLNFDLESHIRQLLAANEAGAYAAAAEALTMGCGLIKPPHPDCARNPQWLRARDDWVDAALCARHPGAASLLASSAPDSWHFSQSRVDPELLKQRRLQAEALFEMAARNGDLTMLIGIAAAANTHRPRNDAATARHAGLASLVVEGLHKQPADFAGPEMDIKQIVADWTATRDKSLAALDERHRLMAAKQQTEWSQPLSSAHQRELLDRPCRNPLSIRLGLKP